MFLCLKCIKSSLRSHFSNASHVNFIILKTAWQWRIKELCKNLLQQSITIGVNRISHDEILKAIDSALAYNEHNENWPLHTYYCSGAHMVLLEIKGRKLRNKYPLLTSWNRHFYLEMYIILNTVFTWCHTVFSS